MIVKATKSKIKRRGAVPGYEGPGATIGYHLWQVLHGWQRHLERALAGLDLTHVQVVLLAMIDWLSDAGDPPSQVELSEAVNFDKMMVSRVCRTLEQRGLLKRVPHARDTRANALELTDAGDDIVARALPILMSAQESFFAPLDEKRRARLTSDLALLMGAHGLGGVTRPQSDD